jgi:hypothetical protein
MAVSSSSGLLYSASNEAETGPNYELFKSGVPANLLLMEGLLSESPDNKDILLTLTKGYAGYAFAVNETDMLNEEWSEAKSEAGKSQALFNYTRAMNFGLRYLRTENIELNDLLNGMNDPQTLFHLLDKQLTHDKKDLELVLFTAQSFAALINLQKDNISLVAQLPVAKAMFDWVCTKNPQINFGTCHIFYGAFEAGRPKMLGGNPAKGKDIFLQAIEQHPDNWLIRSSYLQYYLIPQNDKEGFDLQMKYLSNKQEEFKAYHVYRADLDNSVNKASWSTEPHLRFYQSLALKRTELMNKYQKQFF